MIPLRNGKSFPYRPSVAHQYFIIDAQTLAGQALEKTDTTYDAAHEREIVERSRRQTVPLTARFLGLS